MVIPSSWALAFRAPAIGIYGLASPKVLNLFGFFISGLQPVSIYGLASPKVLNLFGF
jgi:hypothetical protein